MLAIVVPPCCASPTHPDALQTGRDGILATDACDDTPDPDPERSFTATISYYTNNYD